MTFDAFLPKYAGWNSSEKLSADSDYTFYELFYLAIFGINEPGATLSDFLETTEIRESDTDVNFL